ncbi:MAG: hypothetical protein ABID54_05500 [Pseudomonadota bacterium]
MGIINISELEPGMRLEEPVCTPDGRMLLREGVQVTEKHISIFKSWGVTEAAVEGVEAPGVVDFESVDDKNPEAMALSKALKDKFSHVLEDEVMVEIMRVAQKQMMKKILNP